MTVRTVLKTNGTRRVGHVCRTQSSRCKSVNLNRLAVYPENPVRNRNVVIEVEMTGGDCPRIFLPPDTALEVVKGILLNLPDVYLAADDELISIFEGAVGRAKADAAAAVRAVTERVGPPKKELTANDAV